MCLWLWFTNAHLFILWLAAYKTSLSLEKKIELFVNAKDMWYYDAKTFTSLFNLIHLIEMQCLPNGYKVII